jgi:hypothetical protein
LLHLIKDHLIHMVKEMDKEELLGLMDLSMKELGKII